ncbi:ExbD/TolR family protein [Sedimentitalea todarodis]|uniref:Biopolymer transporter ExbD n=1 Tax=Sedimentitalea todarodis TaxID=1631240 RepID=A0ABU3VBM0_9RHOB|nr:biopolymer transporter ExbD [Sedimentitalea todarodis]MDU9003570.1 biopolymer transporter ExbD [Sedimentitalea todarodis]
MQFSAPPRRQPTESIVPMINVVFLLLIFFLMSTQIAPPEPFEVDPPVMDAPESAKGEFRLYLDAEGQLGYLGVIGEDEALAALVAAREAYCADGPCSEDAPPPLILRADAKLPAARLAALMPKLGAAGFRVVQLVTAKP